MLVLTDSEILAWLKRWHVNNIMIDADEVPGCVFYSAGVTWEDKWRVVDNARFNTWYASIFLPVEQLLDRAPPKFHFNEAPAPKGSHLRLVVNNG